VSGITFNKKDKLYNFFFGLLASLASFVLTIWFIRVHGDFNKIILIGLLVIETAFCWFGWTKYYVIQKPKEKKGDDPFKGYTFTLPTQRGKYMEFYDPFYNFLMYAGANSGKTKAWAKWLVGEYIRNNWAGVYYDVKDGDYTRTINHFLKKYPQNTCEFYVLDFEKPRHRSNPIKPSVLKSPVLLAELMGEFFKSFRQGKDKGDDWEGAAIGVLRGVAHRFFVDFPEICTLPHILTYIAGADSQSITSFLMENFESASLAGGFIKASGSEKTQASVLFTLNNNLGTYILNKRIMWVLSGDDFNFNLIEPEHPKIVSLCSSYQLQSMLAPVMGMAIKVLAKHFTMANKIPCTFFFDEMTTFKVSEFEGMPSLLREYGANFNLVTQNAAKIEALYEVNGKRSIEGNFGNRFVGSIGDDVSLKSATEMFTRKEEKRVTTSRSSNDSTNTSISKQKENKYEQSYIRQLKAGEFIGIAKNSNYKEFHVNLQFYTDKEEDFQIEQDKIVTEEMLEWNFKKIKNEIDTIVNAGLIELG
jgi:hypothetical protein